MPAKKTTKSEPVGRPTIYSRKVAERICELVSSSSLSLQRICKDNDDIPARTTVFRWLMEKEEFRDLYARAKRNQITVFMDEIVEITDDSSQDEIEDAHGNLVANSEHIARSRLRCDTRKWLASKLVPKVYGERQITESTVTIKHEDALKELE